MSASFRRFRFERKASRAQWYVGPWIHGSLAASVPLLVLLLGAQRSVVAWIACGAVLALAAWRWRQQRIHEAAFWEQKRRLAIWFEDGRLRASSDGVPLSGSEPLDDVTAVDVLIEKGRPTRLLVDRADGRRTIYAGFDDMEAFAREFRLAAPRAKFRRVRLCFPMQLKEI